MVCNKFSKGHKNQNKYYNGYKLETQLQTNTNSFAFHFLKRLQNVKNM